MYVTQTPHRLLTLFQELLGLLQKLIEFQKKYVLKNPNSLTNLTIRAGMEPKDEREGQMKKDLNLQFLQKMAILESKLDEIYARTVCPPSQGLSIFSLRV